MYQNLAVVGATGAVGSIVRRLLEDRRFPLQSIKFLASQRSAGSTLQFCGETHTVELLSPDSFDSVDLVIASTPDDVAAEFVPWAVQRQAVVVDESGYFRMMEHVPLVVPEVNPEDAFGHSGIIANPNWFGRVILNVVQGEVKR